MPPVHLNHPRPTQPQSGQYHQQQQHQPVNELQRAGLHLYQLKAPEWRLPIQINQPDLGYPGLHPPHPGQHEDAITKSLVQWGFAAHMLVSTESFSAHQMIYKKLTDDTGFNVSSAALFALIEARRRFYAIHSYDTKSTIKIPGRVTLNDQKRENWLRELADNSVPLLKLSKNIPHGFKGEKLLEMLVNRKIDCARATWYIRLIGLNEINAQRNKNDLSHIRYTLTFSSEVFQFLQKQLGEITVPLQLNLTSSTTSLISTSARLAGMNVRSKPKSSTLSDPETRKIWVAKWNQSCMLLKRLYFESLVDQPALFKWLVDQLKTANLAQINFLLEIHQSVLDRFNLSSNVVRGFVEACLTQIRFIAKQTATSYLLKLEHRLKLAVQSAFVLCPDNFVWPDLWISNKVLLEDIIIGNPSVNSTIDAPLQHNVQAFQLREVLKADFFAVNWRVNEIIGEVGIGTGVVGNIFTRRAQLVEILDSHTDYNDCSKLYYKYFLNPPTAGHGSVSFKDKLEVLLSWATTPLRHSDKRVYLVAATLSHVKQDRKKNDDEFQNILIGWLEQIESIEGGDLLVRLFSELSRHNIFSCGAYVQRMVAKGDTECDMMAGKARGLQALLTEWMPLASSRASRERSSSLKRSPGRDSARNGLMAIISDFNSAIASTDCARFATLLKRRLDVCQPSSANRKLLAEILPNALIHLVSELSFSNPASSAFSVMRNPNHPHMASALLTWGIQLLESCQAYPALCDIIQRIVQIDLCRVETLRDDDRARPDLPHSFLPSFHYLQVICTTASNHKEILEISGQLATLISRLFALYAHFRRLIRGTSPAVRGFVRCLKNLIIESNAVDGQILEVLDKEIHPVFDDILPGPSSSGPLPSRTMEISQLIQSHSNEEVSQLVFKYWEENRSDLDWGPTLWNSLITAIKTHSQENINESLCKDTNGIASNPGKNPGLDWETIMQFCEDLDLLYDEGLIGCIVRAGSSSFAQPEEEPLLCRSANLPDSKIVWEEEEGEESEGVLGDTCASRPLLFRTPRSLSREVRRLIVELLSSGLISIDVALEEFVIRPLSDDIPHLLAPIDAESNFAGLVPNLNTLRTTHAAQALNQAHEIYELISDVFGVRHAERRFHTSNSPDKESSMTMAPSQLDPDATLNSIAHESLDHPAGANKAGSSIEQYVRIWRLDVERKLWFEQSDESLGFCSQLLLSLLIATQTVSDLGADTDTPGPLTLESFQHIVRKILLVYEDLRGLLCQGFSLLRRFISTYPAAFLNPILDLINKNDLGTVFNTKLIHSIDELLPYPHTIEPVNQKYPYLESIFKATCIFNHTARTRQFQAHIRLLMSLNPPQMPALQGIPADVTNILGSLVEVMAKRLHLTDSKDASPLFLDCLPAPVAEALIIKLSLYLGMSICKLLGPNQADTVPEVSRIHHICRCITTLTSQLTIRTYEPNDDISCKVVGGSGPLSCNATLESYMSYWQQLKSGLSLVNSRVAAANGQGAPGSKRMEHRIMRALLHSTQVMLWSLPGLTQHLGTVKQTIAEIWIEICLRVQGDSALQNQIMDTIGILLFPTIPDESSLTATVGILRKRFRWLYLPIINLDDGTNLIPSSRLKYLLGSSLRGSSITFQERLKDGAVKFVEEKPWEELEKMDLSSPGFISIDALKCQTLSQVETIPVPKQFVEKRNKSKRLAGEKDESTTEDMDAGNEGDERLISGMQHDLEEEEEEEEGPARGERDSFEHELITDGLSTIPLHFLRSLFPPASRLSGEDGIMASEQQKLVEIQEEADQSQLKQRQIQVEVGNSSQDSSRPKKRKGLPLAPSPSEQTLQSTAGPTLRSARSTRKKSSAGAPSNPPAASSSKRTKKR